MNDIRRSKPILYYRWLVFLLAAGYSLYMMFFSSYAQLGGPFRFLTIWALLASFFCASRMIAVMEDRSDMRWDAMVTITAVLNGMVVFLYWRLYFIDPALVNSDEPVWWREYYLHLLGPMLQWIDALFIHRGNRRPLWAAVGIAVVISLYVAWIEGIVQRLSNFPAGSVTSGLPYPFLNDMTFTERLTFYVSNFMIALILLTIVVILAALLNHLLPRRPQATP
ncbi:hypothetical protein [Parasulfitobacter algicola]|uniref:FAR-17a/AIG1-like protein n=1 Tax=Parasulfitobacter algicola TaxID=2614809 RepID=A0ABX2J1C5_9RHOB|nr:hypothetical protein [Sulfitobacter algicola]NSX56678.1 hypothetical protein [Sulfitobacter algicola]